MAKSKTSGPNYVGNPENSEAGAAAAQGNGPTGGTLDLFAQTNTRQPPQPNKYIGVASPYYDQNPDGTWFLRPGYSYTDPNNYLESTANYPQYYEGDEYMFAGASPETVAALQQKLVEAGLMPKKYNIGVWSADTSAAFKQVLAQANTTGSSWQYALDTLSISGKASGLAGAGSGPVFTAHLANPDDLRNVLRQTAYNVLGGKFLDPSQEDTFINSFHQMQLNSQRAAFDAATGGGGTVTDAPSATTSAEAEVKTADPLGAKAKLFDDYASVFDQILNGRAAATNGN